MLLLSIRGHPEDLCAGRGWPPAGDPISEEHGSWKPEAGVIGFSSSADFQVLYFKVFEGGLGDCCVEGVSLDSQ